MTATVSYTIQLTSCPNSAGIASTVKLAAFAFCAGIIVISVFKTAYVRPRDPLSAGGGIAVNENDVFSTVEDGKANLDSPELLQKPEKANGNAPRMSLWAFSWNRWWKSSLLPFSFHLSETPKPVGANAGVATAQSQQDTQRPSSPYLCATQGQAAMPVTPPPIPSPYNGQPPLSAAKLIMSRHTYRRPSPNRYQSVSVQFKWSSPPSPTRPQPSSRLPSTSLSWNRLKTTEGERISKKSNKNLKTKIK